MAVIQAVLALVSRSLGKVVAALFGWAVVALFGQTSPAREDLALDPCGRSRCLAYPAAGCGVAQSRHGCPGLRPPARGGTVLVDPSRVDPAGRSGPVRTSALPWPPVRVVPARRFREPWRQSDPRIEEREESTLLRLLRGIPITIAIAVSFFLVFVTVPMQRIASMVRRRLDVHVPLVTDARAYQVVAAEIAATLNRHNFAVAPRKPPWWLTAPSRVLLGLGGSSLSRIHSRAPRLFPRSPT